MDFYDIGVRTIDGGEQTLAAYRNQVLLIVNVASQCGFTPQYAGLQALHRIVFRAAGLPCSAFPATNLGSKNAGDEAQIKAFSRTSYEVTFPLFSKIEVNGPGAHPLYQYLKRQQSGLLGTEGIKWNFTKFLVDRQGKVFSGVMAP